MKLYRGFVGACVVVMEQVTWKFVELNEYYDETMFYTEVLGNLLGNNLLLSFALFDTFGVLELKTFGKSLAEFVTDENEWEKIKRLVYEETLRLPFQHLDPFPRNILYDGKSVKFIDCQRIVLGGKTCPDFVVGNIHGRPKIRDIEFFFAIHAKGIPSLAATLKSSAFLTAKSGTKYCL